MLSLINRMLEISKTESGASSLLKTEFDLVALVNRSAELFRMVTGQKRQTLEVAVPADPVRLFADQGKIRQLLANLLDNASKFTSPGGTIRVEVSGRPDAVILAVSDTGCGISPEDREHVFKRFYRADSSRNLPGNGLGLSMMLESTAYNLSEIALMCGFADLSYFSRLFRKHCGEPPGSFRNRKRSG